MHTVYFDSGTSNSRAYLIREHQTVDFAKKNVGSKDVSISGNNMVLLYGLKELYKQLLERNGLTDGDIDEIYASGMVTCPFGIKEVSHITTPVSLKKLRDSIYTHYEPKLFCRNIFLIRGVKTISEDYFPDIKDIAEVNNVRGEEIEIFGLLSGLQDEYENSNLAIFLPGSHTHVAYVRQGVLCDILSTFSGELHHAIASETIISASIRDPIEKLDNEMVLLGYKYLKEYGLNRALYIAHAMKIFNISDNTEIKSYISGVINGGTILAFKKVLTKKWRDINAIIVAGGNVMVQIDEIILKRTINNIQIISVPSSDTDSFAVKGFIKMLKQG